ncbi:ABC transporter permease [Algimonas arctica]|uniref:ABC transporter permease n=1 Tax=Algimonas arctica TaxID=1479486 RepID=A0A8J3G197_9PROT|nr:ABC transporter permease [Algimonas arctica]GHA83096.1 ABC transporter permease [Algimonas arctica]
MLSTPAIYDVSLQGTRLIVKAHGHWTVETAASVFERLDADYDALNYESVEYHLQGVEALDTAGAYILTKAVRVADVCKSWELIGGTPSQQTLLSVAADCQMGDPPRSKHQWIETLDRLGRATVRFADETFATLSFIGQFFVMFFGVLIRPKRMRLKSIIALMEEVGLDAAPIVAVLAFAIGAVIAYMGANLLGALGFSVFMVDLVGISMLRELAGVITAILIAGRSASAFTAQIGAMKMRQEIDAMTVMGLDTFETLVIPRAIACLLTLPILTFLAMISGILGGLIVAWVTETQISPFLFLSRLQEMVDIKHFWVGMVKAPFFAIVIAIIGCRQGLAVSGSVDSLGSRVTTAVVQAIFAVILIDALFAILFYQLGV